jgi:hypothetical protein
MGDCSWTPGKGDEPAGRAAVPIFHYLLRGIDPALVWAEIRAMTWRELTTPSLLAVMEPMRLRVHVDGGDPERRRAAP